MAATPTGDSWIGEWGRLFDAASRLGGFDPFYGAARAAAIARWGAGIGAMVAASAARFPSRVAVDDGEGRLTYRELDRAASNAAAFLQQLAAQAEQSTEADREPTVGILCRNHRWFLVAQLAAERAGLDLVLLSTALPAAKLAEVTQREGLIAVVADREFLDVVAVQFLHGCDFFSIIGQIFELRNRI